VERERKQSITPKSAWKSPLYLRQELPEKPRFRRRPGSLEFTNLSHQKLETLCCVLYALGFSVQSRLDSRKTGLQGENSFRALGDYLLDARKEFRRHNHSGLKPWKATEMFGGMERPEPPRCSTVVPDPISPLKWDADYVDEGSRIHLRGIRQTRKFSTDWDAIHLRIRWPNVNWFKCKKRVWRRAATSYLDNETKKWVLDNLETVEQTPKWADVQIDEIAARMRGLTGVDLRCDAPELSPDRIEALVEAYRRGDLPWCENCGSAIQNPGRLIHAIRVTKGMYPAAYCDEESCRRAAQAARKRLERRRDDILASRHMGQAAPASIDYASVPRKVREFRTTLVDGESDPWRTEPVTRISSLLVGEKASFCPDDSRITQYEE